MPRTISEKRVAFRDMHRQGCFILPNAWDAGSARLFERVGFSAIASTSSGLAWTMGRGDYGLELDDVLPHLATLAAATDLPVNADFEAGFAPDPEGVATNVGRAISIGVAGLSIEDRDLSGDGLHELPVALERLRAARTAIAASGEDVLLVARTEGLLLDRSAIHPAIDRLVAFAQAGADCLYAPGVMDRAAIADMVRAVAPLPVNVLALDPTMTLSELADLGVRRVSVGGSLAAVGWAAVIAAAKSIRAGDFSPLASRAQGLDSLFSPPG